MMAPIRELCTMSKIRVDSEELSITPLSETPITCICMGIDYHLGMPPQNVAALSRGEGRGNTEQSMRELAKAEIETPFGAAGAR